jgi:hypothetical protein
MADPRTRAAVAADDQTVRVAADAAAMALPRLDAGQGGRDFYIRQRWDMKGSVDIATLQPFGLGFYGGICGWALARAHARTGSVAIAAYLGTSDDHRDCADLPAGERRALSLPQSGH